MDPQLLAAYGFGLLLLYVVVRLFYRPLRWVGVAAYRAVLGGLALWAVNLAGALFGLHLPLNPVTALAVGYLGIPGFLMVAALQFCVR
ncbi:MAG: pro-sigmaK processing inhibitor BofA family protein [Bacillota bacterium]